MSFPISPINPAAGANGTAAIQTPGAAKPAGDFRDLVTGAIQKVEQAGQTATQAVEGFLAGEGQELHTAMLAVQRADLAFDLGLQVRNKVISAYQEIMRLQM